MQRFRFPIAVALTSLGLVALLLVGGGLLVRSALAYGPWSHAGFGPPWMGAHGAWSAAPLPAQLSGLRDLPADERFTHFKSAQLSLTDRDGQPVVLAVTPGTATAVDGSNLTVATNEGSTRTFTLDAQTVVSGPRAFGSAQAGQPGIATGDRLVVVTINGSNTATAVWAMSLDHWGERGSFGH